MYYISIHICDGKSPKVPKLLPPCTAFTAGLSNGGKHYAVIIAHSKMQINFSLLAMPRLRKLGAGFSPRIPWLDPWSIRKGFSRNTLAFRCLRHSTTALYPFFTV